MALGIKTEDILKRLDEEEQNGSLLQSQKKTSVVKDVLAAPFRGVEGAAQGLYQLADWATFDYLPDYDNRFLGKSETIAGGLVEGITQFIVPYGAIAKGASLAGKATKFGKHFMKTNKKGKEVLNWKGVLASETATDFIAFDAQEERLSNLMQAFPSMANPVAEFLAAEDDDGEIEGRLKNAIEGLGITGTMASAFGLAIKAHKGGKDGIKKLREAYDAKGVKPENDPRNRFNQKRTVPMETYSPAARASKSVFGSSKKIKDGGVMAHQLRKEFDAYGEKGTGEELRWMGFDDWLKEKGTNRVTQKEVDTFLEEKQFKFELIERSGGSTNETYSGFKQTGGDNYREFTLNSAQFKDFSNVYAKGIEGMDTNKVYTPHFSEDNLIHFRTTDRSGANGERVLFVEELQSDPIQAKRKAKIDPKVKDPEGKLPLEDSHIGASMRMIMQLASKEGYDRVQWATPQQVAGLYDAQLDNLKLNKINPDGTKEFDITYQGQTTTKVIKPEEMENTFGKGPAEKINTTLLKEGDEIKNFEAKQDAKSFNQYKDKMVSAVNKLGKSFGSKVEIDKADTGTIAGSYSYNNSMRDYARENAGTGSPREILQRFLADDAGREFLETTTADLRGKQINTEDFLLRKIKEQQEFNYYASDEGFVNARSIDELTEWAGSKLDFDDKDMFDGDLLIATREFVSGRKFDQGALPSKGNLEGFSININDGMKKSVQEIPTWGLKTGDDARMGGAIQDPALANAMKLPAIRYVDDKELVQMEENLGGNVAGETTAGFALERFAANGSTPQIKQIASGLLEMMGKDNEFLQTNVGAVIKDTDALGSFGFAKDGSQNIDMYTNQTSINKGTMDGDAVFGEATLLHEITHAAQVRYIPKEISTISDLRGADYLAKVDEMIADGTTSTPVKRLLESYKTALDNVPEEFKGILDSLNDANKFADGKTAAGVANRTRLKEWYGLTNVDEFLAEAMTNVQFQDFLKSVKTGNTSLWDNIVEVIKDFLGVDAKGTLLGDTISNFADLVSNQNKKYATSDYTTIYKNPIRSRGSRISEGRLFKQAAETASEGVKVTERGGKIALDGTIKAIGNVETAHDLGEVLANAEQAVFDEMEKSGSIGFYRDGKLEASDGLKTGGEVQAIEQARRMAEASGQKIDIVENEIREAGGDANKLRAISARMYTVESMAVQQGDELVKKAHALQKAGASATDEMRAELMGDVQKMLNLVAAGSNLRRGFGQGLQSTQFARTKLSLSGAERRSQEIVNQYMANLKGEKANFDKLLNNIILAGGNPKNVKGKDMIDQMLGLSKALRANQGGKFMEMAQNWFVNSLLSGPRTMMKNGVGNMIAQTMLQTELAVGGITVNPAITRHVMKEMATMESFRESMQFFLKAYEMGDQLLDIGRNPLENNAKNGIPKYFDNAAPEDTMKNAFNWFGDNVVNMPAKILMSMDDVFKQSLFRQNAKLEWTLKGMKLGIKNPDELTEYVTRGMDAVLVDGERAFSDAGVMKFAQNQVSKMDEDAIKNGGKSMTPQERGSKVNAIISSEIAKRSDMMKSVEEGGLGLEDISDIDNISARSLEQARYGTFTNDAGAFADLAQAMVKKVPLLGLVFPFIRTPVNILKFSFDRASFGGMEVGRNILAKMPDMPMIKQTQDQLRLELNSRTPIEQARARGKIATATMINSTLLYMIFSNRDFITGGGPKNEAERRTLEQTGWQKYSFHFGDKYAGYNGLDPFGTQFGVLVDLVEQFDSAGSINSTVAEQVFAAATISLSRNVTDKSYLAGLQFITDALSEPDRKMERAVRNIAGGFVPNILYQSQSIAGDVTGREVRSLSDAFMKKLPMGADNLDPRRNILGESVVTENIPFVGPFNPMAMSTEKNDDIFTELAQLEHGFSQVSTTLDRTIDMTEYGNEKGQTAYDRRLEILSTVKIRGKTLRQSLEKLMATSRYKNMSPLSDGGFKSPRVQLINKVLGKYRSRSLNLMLQEFPEIQRQYDNNRKAKKIARSGANSAQIAQLLNINPNQE